jgi:uncharacterized protein YjbI with pentapeptide repeats
MIMTSTKNLRSRWKTTSGKIAARAVENALRHGSDIDELHGYTAGMPYIDEVAPNLDLRGIELPNLVAVRASDLSGVRFDAAQMNWNFGGCTLRKAVFDRANGHNVDFGGCDLSGGSLVGARLPGAIFYGARLIDSDLSGIRMHSGQLKGADCRGAKFVGADLRMVWAADADIRGADFREANLVGASLGRVKWNETTRFEGAQMSWEGTPTGISTQAIAQGAKLTSEKAEWQLGLVDATRKVLEERNRSGKLTRIVRRMETLRLDVERDPQTLWANKLQKELSEKEWREFQEAVQTAASNMGVFLD